MAGTKLSFAEMLRRYRLQAGLTQEDLAERAGLSANGLGALERGTRQRPHRQTVELLIEALGLEPADRAALAAAARIPERSVTSVPSLESAPVLGAAPTTPLIGRAEELDRMGAILSSVAGGRGHFLLLEGESGSGKTRLLHELRDEAGARGFAVTATSCEVTQPSPYLIFRRTLPAFAQHLPAGFDSMWTAFRDASDTGTTYGSPSSEDDILTAVSDLMLSVAQPAPLALLLDDVQSIDEKSVAVLHHLTRVTHNSPVLIACALRDVELETAHPVLAEMLRKLSHDHLLDIITVRRLSYDETATFLGDTLDGSVSDEFVAFAHRRTKGNPRLLDDLVRSLGGRLQLQGEIGAGAMGRVFRAYDSVTRSTVAAKLMLARVGIDLDALLRFQQEGAVLRSMDHPHIVRIHDSFVEEHVSCIVMELLEGKSLAKILADGPLDLARTKAMALQIAGALDYAHTQSIVHRDVKPDNIMVLEGDRVKVTDFGIARILSVDTKMGTIATTGMRVGTPLYMSPEQIEGKKVDARSDIYGFGAVLYDMVTGRPPFEGDDALAIAVQQMKDDPEPPGKIRPGLPREWDAVILKALAKEPRHRFQSISEMKTSVEHLGTAMTGKPYRPVSKWRYLTIASALFIVIAGAVFGYATTTSHATAVTLSSYLSSLASQGRLSGTVVMAKRGRVLLDNGYGLANSAAHIANGPNTDYGLANAATTGLLTAAMLQLTQNQRVYRWNPLPNESVCPTYPAPVVGCPKKWGKPLDHSQNLEIVSGKELSPSYGFTFDDLIEGRSGLPSYRWGRKGNTLAQTLSAFASMPLGPVRSRRVQYSSCANVLLARFLPFPSGLIPTAHGTYSPNPVLEARIVAGLERRQIARQLTDSTSSPRLALEYDSSGAHTVHEYDDYFAAYSTAPALDRYDHLILSDTFMPRAQTRELLSPRGIAAPADPGIKHVEWADGWKTGFLFGKRVDYISGSLYDYRTANLLFPRSGLTVVVMSNSATTDALNTAEHAAAFELGGKQPRLATEVPASPADLVGTFERPVRAGDAAAVAAAERRHDTEGLPSSGQSGRRRLLLSIAPTSCSWGQYRSMRRPLMEACSYSGRLRAARRLASVRTRRAPPRATIAGRSSVTSWPSQG